MATKVKSRKKKSGARPGRESTNPNKRPSTQVEAPQPVEPTSPQQSVPQPQQAPIKDGVGREWWHPEGQYGVIRITKERKRTLYFLKRMSSTVFTLEKMDSRSTTIYPVNIGPVKTCGCHDFQFHGSVNNPCKHIKALVALDKKDKLK